jgi:DNA-binding NtrC family response regulator
MMNQAPSILSISYDESLLQTRRLILESAGFAVTSALGYTQAMGHCKSRVFDVVIIGHSIPFDVKESLLRTARAQKRPAVVVLWRPGDGELSGADLHLDAWEGPEALVSTVRKAVNLRDSSAANP